MTIKQETGKATANPAAVAARAGTPRHRLIIILASVVLVLLAGVVPADFTGHLSPWEPKPALTT